MPYPKYWTKDKLEQLKALYNSGLSMREVGTHFGKSIWSINSAMRNNSIPCRKRNETNKIQFLKSPLSFSPKKILSQKDQLLKISGLMLYWGEGAKKNTHSVDFANSDPDMIIVFIKFLRNIYHINEEKFRIYLYSYNSLPTNQLIDY